MNDKRVQAVAVCDVQTRNRDNAQKIVNQFYGADKDYRGCKPFGDFRELLADKGIDAVMIATPDHWHAITAIEAVKAGKDGVLRKAAVADDPARTENGRGRQTVRRGLPDRHPAAERAGISPGLRAGPQRPRGKTQNHRGRGPRQHVHRRRLLRAGPAGHRLRSVAGTGADGAVFAQAGGRVRLAVDFRLCRRLRDRLGRPPHGHCAVGDGHHAHRPGGGRGQGASFRRKACSTPRCIGATRPATKTA